MRLKKCLYLFLSVWINILFISKIEASTLYVPSIYPTVQEAIDAASSGDTVLVDSGIYSERIILPSSYSKTINVQGEMGAILDGGGGGSVVTFAYESNSTLKGFTIQNGLADYGGGIYCEYGSPTITDCTLIDNRAYMYGGGIFSSGASITISRCTIKGNQVGEYGGGIAFWDSGSSKITNCVISGNSAGMRGGGIDIFYHSSLEIINCSISGNSAGENGGGIACYYSYYATPVVVLNGILWGNEACGGANEVYMWESTLGINYSIFNPAYIIGSSSGSNNLNLDPLFVLPVEATLAPTTEGDYHLLANSPGINSGTTTNAPDDDIDGEARPQGSGIDRGADEHLCMDVDQDSYFDIAGCGTDVDCDDENPVRFPGNPEVCDGVDNDCNGEIDDHGSCVATLSEGWNLISLNRQSDNTAIVEVLGAISDNCDSVWAFNNGWKAYYPAYPEYSDLETMEAGWGYWLKINSSAALTTSGDIPSGTISLVKGWNLVGYNSAYSMPVAEAIESINENCESVWQFKDGMWRAYYPAYPEYSDLDTMEPHYGYWIKTTEACDWILPLK